MRGILDSVDFNMRSIFAVQSNHIQLAALVRFRRFLQFGNFI